MKSLTWLAMLFAFGFSCAQAGGVPGSGINAVPEAKRVKTILQQPESIMDLAVVKLTIDKMIEPSIDINANLKKIDSIVVQILAMAGSNSSSNAKLLALKRYLYEKGPWNNNEPYQYDFADPRGTKINNKLLPTYLATKKGNCVSMPFLFVVLGQRLGLDVSASTAPEHYFVKYTDPDVGITYNLETTSGANPTRDMWYRQEMPMTDEAIANGIYLQALTKRETAALMATILAENFAERREPEKVIAIADAVLPFYAKNIGLILGKGSAYSRLIKREFVAKYPRPVDIPAAEVPYFHFLAEQNRLWFAKAESLGWQQPSMVQEVRYQETVNQAKSSR
jgi:regulator of sirC expression with transglutaminase-like and TPR domain